MASIKQKVAFHEKRSNLKDNKGAYSRLWLTGYKDNHAKDNLSSYGRSYAEARVSSSKNDKILSSAMLNGCVARIKSDKKNNKKGR